MNKEPKSSNANIDDITIYEQLLPQLTSLLSPEEPVITNLSNFSALLKSTFSKISWVGFYLLKNNILYLGPFQGKTACTQIKVGNGVCGTSAAEKRAIVVPNVNEFAGHIACDSGSKSEIVVPVIYSKNIVGVLDVDSYSFSAFTETDEYYLTKFCNILCSKINFSNFTLQ